MRSLSWMRPCLRALPQLQGRVHYVGFRPSVRLMPIWRQGMTQRWFAKSSSSKQAEIKVPSLGDSITEGEVVEISKQVGNYINIDDVVAVLETDKVSVDIRSEHSGTITSVKYEPGNTVKIGDVLFTLDTDPDSVSRPHPVSPPPPDSNAAKLTHVAKAAETPAETPLEPKPSAGIPAALPFAESASSSSYAPSIQFRYGVRETAVSTSQRFESAGSDASPADAPWVPTPERYRRPRVSQAEIDAIESGGATFRSMFA